MVLEVIELILALVLYTLGIFGFRREAKWRYVVMLIIGLAFDWHASITMIRAAAGGVTTHGIIGLAALILMTMFVTFITAVRFLAPWQQRWRRTGNIGILVYGCWLLSFFTGALMAR